MPFDPPFRDAQPGDLVAGPSPPGGGLIDWLHSRAQGRVGLPGPMAATDLADFLAPASAVDPVSAAFHAATRAHSSYADVFSPEHPPAYRERQRGKAVLHWCTLGGGPFVHYSLDGLDDVVSMQSIAQKNAAADSPAGKFDPDRHAPLTRHTKSRFAAGAELRWLFRHRDVSLVRQRVQFWRRQGAFFVPCPPPWDWPDAAGSAWQAYRPSREYSDADTSAPTDQSQE